MDFALPAVLILLIISPGSIFWFFFTRLENVSLERSPLIKILLAGILLSTLMHWLWLSIGCFVFGYSFDLKLLLMLMGDLDLHLNEVSESLEAYYKQIIFYWISLLLASVALGRVLRSVIENNNWDLGEHWINEALRLDSSWHYLFNGGTNKPASESEEVDAILIAAIVELDGNAYLYRGFLVDYVLKDSDTLDRLIIESPQRRLIDKDKTATEETNDERFYDIDGDYFVLRYDEIKTLNVYYLDVETQEANIWVEST